MTTTLPGMLPAILQGTMPDAAGHFVNGGYVDMTATYWGVGRRIVEEEQPPVSA